MALLLRRDLSVTHFPCPARFVARRQEKGVRNAPFEVGQITEIELQQEGENTNYFSLELRIICFKSICGCIKIPKILYISCQKE